MEVKKENNEIRENETNVQKEEQEEKVAADVVSNEFKTSVRIMDAERDFSSIEVKNPRIGKVLKLQEETERQQELERLRTRRIRQEQEYIDRMLQSVEQTMKDTKEEQKLNEEFEQHIRMEIYKMHGISEDKLQGMTERRTAWYQGAAFALFFLSILLIVLCGVLHGFGSEVCIFMAFYTAIEGTLLSNGRKQSVFFETLIKALYLLLFPMMMVIFVCYELGFSEYKILVPIFVVIGVIVLMIGAVSYFVYDPYRVDRKNKKKAHDYIKEMEKTALKEVRLKEKKAVKMEKAEEKSRAKTEKKNRKKEKHQKYRERAAAWWYTHKPFRGKKTETEEKTEEEIKEEEKECEPDGKG